MRKSLRLTSPNKPNPQPDKLKKLPHTHIGLMKRINPENSLPNKDHKKSILPNLPRTYSPNAVKNLKMAPLTGTLPVHGNTKKSPLKKSNNNTPKKSTNGSKIMPPKHK